MNEYKKYLGKFVSLKLKKKKNGRREYKGRVSNIEIVNPVTFITIKNLLGKKEGFYDKEISSIKEIIK